MAMRLKWDQTHKFVDRNKSEFIKLTITRIKSTCDAFESLRKQKPMDLNGKVFRARLYFL